MSQKVRMRIYRLSGFQKTAAGTTINVLEAIPVWKYLQGVSVNDIVFANKSDNSALVGTIILNSGNIPNTIPEKFPNVDFTIPFSVTDSSVTQNNSQTDVNGSKYYVNVGGRVYYILPDQVDVSNLTILPSVFEFYINPENVTPVYKKLNTEIRTRGGWEIQHYGNALTEIKVKGRTGGVHKDVSRTNKPGGLGQTLQPGESITKSTAWQRLNQLKYLYDSDQVISNVTSPYKIGFNYYDRFFVGYFTEFQGPEADKDQPYNMTYSFEIKVERELSGFIGVNAGVIDDSTPPLILPVGGLI